MHKVTIKSLKFYFFIVTFFSLSYNAKNYELMANAFTQILAIGSVSWVKRLNTIQWNHFAQ